jgi:dephospho-CoA kinase
VPAAPFIGLTGAVAAGKSEALSALDRLGVATLSADAVVHDLLASERVVGMLVERWGAEVASDGEIDRARVGRIVFERPEELDWLERALHPLVAERIASWRAGLPTDTTAAVVEVPLLFETGMDPAFDLSICIVAADRTRAERAGARGTGELEGRSRRQLSQEEKAARATHVVANDGTLAELEAALAEVLAQIERAA